MTRTALEGIGRNGHGGGGQRGPLFRLTLPNQHSRVTNAELFFDLVFVFAVTQVSLGRFTPLGVLQVTLLFRAVWWVWVYTTWITNWLDPGRTPVRILLFLLMLGGLVLSTSIPPAFEARGIWFASAYAAMQVGRTLFLVASTSGGLDPARAGLDPAERGTRARKRDQSGSRNPPNPAGWRGSPIPTCTCRSSPASSSRPSPMNWC